LRKDQNNKLLFENIIPQYTDKYTLMLLTEMLRSLSEASRKSSGGTTKHIVTLKCEYVLCCSGSLPLESIM